MCIRDRQMEEAVFTDEKQQREETIREITDKFAEAFAENEEWLAVLDEAVYQYQKKLSLIHILQEVWSLRHSGIRDVVR